MKLISRKEAIGMGFKHYFTQKPCKQGHVCERYSNNGNCVQCVSSGTRKHATQLREKAMRSGQNFYFTGRPCLRNHIAKRYVQNGTCYECQTERQVQNVKSGISKQWHQNFRRKVILHLGSKCTTCGVMDVRTLQVDHTKGGGNKEIKSVGSYNTYKQALQDRSHKYQLLCANCNFIKVYTNKEILHNPKAYMRRIRKAVLNRLGNQCKRCGISDFRCLQIDHISGGGCKDRSAFNNNTYKYYKHILSDKSSKYQLLCANCNWIKRFEVGETRTYTK